MAEEYINRLIRCGYSPSNAYYIYHDFLKTYAFSEKELNEFILSVEKDNRYVDRIQS